MAARTTRGCTAVLCLAVLLAAAAAGVARDAEATAMLAGDEAEMEAEAAARHQCCPSGPLQPQLHGCADHPTARPLRCPQGFYMLEPHAYAEDAFALRDGLLQFGNDHHLVAPGQFCVGRVVVNATTLPVALVCFEADPEGAWPRARNIAVGVCLCVSVVFLAATLAVYAMLPPLRDLDGRVLVCYVAALAVADLVLALLQFHGHEFEHATCVMQAFFLYFWLLAAFFWLNVVSFNVWRRTINLRLALNECRLFTVYCVYGFGMPILFTVVALFTEHVPGDHLRPNFGLSKCWFQDVTESWLYFYGPVAVLLSCNVIFFIWTLWALWRDYSHIQAESKLRSLRCKCMLYLKLAILMGISWIFEIISFAVGDLPFFVYCTDIINCLQGVIIFVFLVLTRKRVLRLLAEKRPCGLAPPAKWAQGPDDESEAMLADEEMTHAPA